MAFSYSPIPLAESGNLTPQLFSLSERAKRG